MPGKHYRYPHMIRLEIEAFLLDRQVKECRKNTLIFYRHELTAFLQLCKKQGIVEMENSHHP